MRDRRNTFEVDVGLLYMGKEERIEQEERNPETRDFFLLWCHTAPAIESKRETRIDGICPKIKGA